MKFTKAVVLSVDSSKPDLPEIMGEILDRHKGGAGIQVVVEFDDACPVKAVCLDLGKEYWIEPSETLISDIEKTPGIRLVKYR